MAEIDMSKYAMPIVYVEPSVTNWEPPTFSGREYEFKTSDGVIRKLPEEVAFQSIVLKHTISDFSDGGNVISCIPLQNVSNDVLTAFELYGRDFYLNPPKKVEPESDQPNGEQKKLLFEKWEAKYREWSIPFLCEVTRTANFLEFKSIENFCVRNIASHITGKNTEQIRKDFGIVSDFTPEQEQKNREEYAWAFS